MLNVGKLPIAVRSSREITVGKSSVCNVSSRDTTAEQLLIGFHGRVIPVNEFNHFFSVCRPSRARARLARLRPPGRNESQFPSEVQKCNFGPRLFHFFADSFDDFPVSPSSRIQDGRVVETNNESFRIYKCYRVEN